MGAQSQANRPESIEKFIANDVEEGGDPVPPADFFAFVVIPAGIGNGHFVETAFQLGQLYGDLWLEPEALGSEPDLVEEFPAEDFVTGFHIRQVQIGEHV